MFDGDAAFSARGKPGSFDIGGTSSIIVDIAGIFQVFKHFHQRWSPIEQVIAVKQTEMIIYPLVS